jgi:transposase
MSTKQVIRAQKFRFYPTKSQEELLAKTFGAVRFVWNKRVESFNNLNGPGFGSCSIKEFKEIYPWLTEVSYNALEQKNQDWIQTKKQFFSKTRKVKLGRPKFKSKTGKKSFIPPTQEEVINYVIEKQLVINPYNFFSYYSKLDWKDNQGKQVKSWKGKAVTWDIRDRKENPNKPPYALPSKPLTPKEKLLCPRCGAEVIAGLCTKCRTPVDPDGKELK